MSYWNAGQIINQALVEVGLESVQDPFTSSDNAHKQMVALLNAAGKELVRMFQWQSLARKHVIDTPAPSGDGVYDLPEDFAYMIPQTHWNETDAVPLFGPTSPAD